MIGLWPEVSPATRIGLALREAARQINEAASVILGEEGPGIPIGRSSAVVDDSLSLLEAVNSFMLAKARSGRADRYLRQLRVVMMSFVSGRARKPLAAVSCEDVERWLDSHEWSARTRRGYLADVRTMFNFCLKRGALSRNPALGVELPVAENLEAPKIHTPDQVRRVLQTAWTADPDVCRHLAVRYFAGVRSSEAHRMTEENILLARGVIEIPAKKAKTRRRRLVTIQPNLRAWLEREGQLRPLSPMTVRAVLKESGVEWHHNVTRHSFVSYHLARFENAGKTALEAGHTEDMLFAHYRELVTPDAAKEFWEIAP